MSWWEFPTTADFGVCAFAPSPERLFEEITLGMQHLLISESSRRYQGLTRHTGTWRILTRGSLDNTLVAWLEEVLYKCEVEGLWLVTLQVQFDEDEVNAQISYVLEEEVQRQVEIKAVTRHALLFRELTSGEEFTCDSPDVPVMSGPGWVAQVIFDI